MDAEMEAAALAAQLDGVNGRTEEVGPTPDAAARMGAIIAGHEAACAALRRAEIDNAGNAPSAEARRVLTTISKTKRSATSRGF